MKVVEAMGCRSEKYARCVVVLAFSIILNCILSYALLYVTNNVSNPVVIAIGWMGLGILIGSLLFSYIEGDEENRK
jgi:steroid 5-alpha reductase family enzyme